MESTKPYIQTFQKKPKNRILVFHLFFIAVGCLLAYASSLNSGFVQEDYLAIVNNKDMAHSSFVIDTFKGEGFHPKLTGYYRPIYILSFFADYKIWGLNPAGFHLTNITIHIIVTFLVYILAAKFAKENQIALLAALLFGLHPINTEVVYYINHRGEATYSLFYLLGVLTFIRYRAGNLSSVMLFFSLLFYMASILTKEGGVTLPLLLLVLDFALLKNERFKLKVTYPYILYLSVLAIYLLMRYFALGGMILDKQTSAPLIYRLMTMPGVVLYYVKLLIIPIPLRLLYPIPILEQWQSTPFLFPFLSLFLMWCGIVYLYFKSRLLFFLSLWPFLVLLPNYNFIPIVGFFMAERYLYLPSAGVCILIAIFIKNLNQGSRKVTSAIACMIVLSFFVITSLRHSVWKDEKTFLETLQKDIEGSFVAYTEQGNVYLQDNLFDEAISGFRKALRVNPGYKPAIMSLAQALEGKERYEEAAVQYRKYLELEPGDARGHLLLGTVYGIMGKIDYAVAELETAVRLKKTDAEAHYTLAIAYEHKGLLKLAVKEYSEASSLMPNWSLPRDALQRFRK